VASTVPVTFRFRGEPGRRVELFGDLPFWGQSHALREEEPGSYACVLELSPGLYRYKFRINRRDWVVDPNAALDVAEGHENSVVVVGGSTPPLFFAPDRRHLVITPEGRLRLHAEVELAAAAPQALSVEGTRLEVREVGQWSNRRLLSAEGLVPASGRFGIETQPQILFELPERQPAWAHRPSWVRHAVLYGIFLDRWHRGGSTRDPRVGPRSAPTSAETFYGGDLDGVRASLDSLKALGVDGIVLTPLHASQTPHRYDTTDHHAIDPRLGGEPALRRLLEAAHARQLKVVADLSFTHVHEQHPAFQDVLKRQKASKYAGWFQLKSFPVRAFEQSTYVAYAGRPELPLLNLEPGPAREHVIEAALELVRLGIDGLRLDAMSEVPVGLWRELRARVRTLNPEVALLGEVVMDLHPFFVEDNGADLITDFQHLEMLKAFFADPHFDAGALIGRLQLESHRQGPFDCSARLLLLDNHDVARFCSVAGAANTRLALTWLLLRPEPVWLTYGTEYELAGEVPVYRLDDAWPERLPMPALETPWTPTGTLLQQLGALRKTLSDAPLKMGGSGRLLWLERATAAGGRILAMLNVGDRPCASRVSEGTTLLSINAPMAEPAAALPPCSGRVVLLNAGAQAG
jgi:cyclomaltodextrinase